MKLAPLIGLLGILIAVISAQLNDALTTTAAQDVGGALGIGSDTTAWLPTLYVTGEILGMSLAPTLATIFTIRRFALFAIGFALLSTLMLALCRDPLLFLALRLLQGFSGGLTIPLLMMVALKVLAPPVRLYGLAVYALSATVAPNLANSLAALWTDGLDDYRFLYLQAAPFAVIGALLVWWGVDQDEPRPDMIAKIDWPGAILVAIGAAALATVLEQGDRLDWFASPLICIAAAVSVIAIPLIVVRDLTAPQPLFLLSLFKRRNFAFGVAVLLVFLVVTLSESQIPLTYLEQVQGYRPAQAQMLSLEIALSQLVFLPFTAWLLDFRHVDARWVIFAGVVAVAVGCLGASRVDSGWSRDQFLAWQLPQSLGSSLVIVSLLMLNTNTITNPADGPYAASLVNTPRAVAEAIGVWVLQLVTRWRGGLHRERLVDSLGEHSAVTARAGTPAQLSSQVMGEVTTLVTSDAFLVMATLAGMILLLIAIVPERTYPPRIALAKH